MDTQSNVQTAQHPILNHHPDPVERTQSPIPNTCPCNGLGYLRPDLPTTHPDFGKLIPCTCQAAAIAARRAHSLNALGTLALYTRHTFATFQANRPDLPPDERRRLIHALDRARAYADDPRGWLLLFGNHGSGKTHLAAAIANHRVTVVQQPALLLTVADLLDHLRATYSPSSTVTYDARFDVIRAAPILVLDDLGAHSATTWAQEKLHQLLDHRYVGQLPTVITTALTLDELEKYDPRLFTRIIDKNHCTHLAILAPPYGRNAQSPIPNTQYPISNIGSRQ